jgi:predicted NAD/FAD-binding protein
VQTTALGRQNVAVIGSGIAGLSAAWLLSQTHDVTIFEADGRLGGHANTAEAPGFQGPVPVDTGFIVYNEANYPNLTALFAYLGAPTINADMSLSVSLDDGAFEYSSFGFSGVFAQKRNLANPRFLKMLRAFTGKRRRIWNGWATAWSRWTTTSGRRASAARSATIT